MSKKCDPPSYFEATGIQGFQTTNYETNWNTDYGPGPGQENGHELGNTGSLVIKSEPTSYSESEFLTVRQALKHQWITNPILPQ